MHLRIKKKIASQHHTVEEPPDNTINPKDLGFGTQVLESVRLIKQDGTFNVKKIGTPLFRPIYHYHELIKMPWIYFLLLIILSFIIINSVFALIYIGIGLDQLAGLGATKGFFYDFWEAFFFSAQTFTTVGYGRISPVGFAASLVASIESMMGLLAFALATGLLFARFARPVAQIIYSQKAIIAPYKDHKAFEFRIVNGRDNQLVEAEVQISLSMFVEENDRTIRKFYNLDVERSKIAFFPLSWTVVHPIDEKSPINHFKSQEDFQKAAVEFLIIIKAFDETFSQYVYSRYSYLGEDIIWGAKFVPMFYPKEGKVWLELNRLNDIIPIDDLV